MPEQKERASPPAVDVPEITKYRLKPPPDFRSQFQLELEDRERRRMEAELQQQEEERQRMIDVCARKLVSNDLLIFRYTLYPRRYRVS